MVYHQGNETFEFHPGGIFANVVVADEINRGTPKTQSALLEVMAERRVTDDSNTRAVPYPFLVIGTQNPIEMEGPYRLPEAQNGLRRRWSTKCCPPYRRQRPARPRADGT
jgi:MoxR-like ATPase